MNASALQKISPNTSGISPSENECAPRRKWRWTTQRSAIANAIAIDHQRQVRVRERLKAVHRAGVERHGGGDQQEIQAPDGVHVAGTAEALPDRREDGLGWGSVAVCALILGAPTSCRRQPFA